MKEGADGEHERRRGQGGARGGKDTADGRVADPGAEHKRRKRSSAFPATSADPARLTAGSWLTQGAEHGSGATSGEDPAKSESCFRGQMFAM